MFFSYGLPFVWFHMGDTKEGTGFNKISLPIELPRSASGEVYVWLFSYKKTPHFAAFFREVSVTTIF